MKNKTRGRQEWKEKKKDPPSVSACFIRCTVQGGGKGGEDAREQQAMSLQERKGPSPLSSLSLSLFGKRDDGIASSILPFPLSASAAARPRQSVGTGAAAADAESRGGGGNKRGKRVHRSAWIFILEVIFIKVVHKN